MAVKAASKKQRRSDVPGFQKTISGDFDHMPSELNQILRRRRKNKRSFFLRRQAENGNRTKKGDFSLMPPWDYASVKAVFKWNIHKKKEPEEGQKSLP